jgi:hypothetical protein
VETYQFYYLDLERIFLFPSTFVAPHLLLGIYQKQISVALSVKVPGATQETAIPSDFINKMKTFSDPTRVAIMYFIMGCLLKLKNCPLIFTSLLICLLLLFLRGKNVNHQ